MPQSQSNSFQARLARMIEYRDSYTGKSAAERRARQQAVLRLMAQA